MCDSQLQTSRDTLLSSEREEKRDTVESDTANKALKAVGSDQPLYFPLVEAQIIQLVELEPGARNDPIIVRFSVTELEHAPEYEAISYVWGNPESTVLILCNGRRLDITMNLNAAFVRLQFTDRPRILWADAVCINQSNLEEHSHQISFIGMIYRYARNVPVCLGQDPDGGAEDVAALVKENADLILKYDSIAEMPILAPNDPLFDNSRWKSMATLTENAWFTCAWVLQEAGLAKDASVLYGEVEFSYRDLMKLTLWVTRCAPNLELRVSVSFYSIHTDWLDWSPNWQSTAVYPNETFLSLLNQARWLACQEHRDHIYACLGHPLAQLDDGQTIITPDYSKHEWDVYLELAMQLLQKHGLCVLSPIEHDERTLGGDFPSWVPFYWDVEDAECTLGVYSGFYYDASAGAELCHPTMVGMNHLEVQGTIVDVVSKAYQFSASDLEDLGTLKSHQSATPQRGTLDPIWMDIWDTGTACAYAWEECLIALSLTLYAGLYTYDSMEENLAQHCDNFAAYWRLRLQSTSKGELPPSLQEAAKKGDPGKFWLDMKLLCKGRSFLLTRKGYYGLGPRIAKPGDICCILFGANVPFLMRNADEASHYKLVSEAYIHGLMCDEAINMIQKDELQEEKFVLC